MKAKPYHDLRTSFVNCRSLGQNGSYLPLRTSSMHGLQGCSAGYVQG